MKEMRAKILNIIPKKNYFIKEQKTQWERKKQERHE